MCRDESYQAPIDSIEGLGAGRCQQQNWLRDRDLEFGPGQQPQLGAFDSRLQNFGRIAEQQIERRDLDERRWKLFIGRDLRDKTKNSF